MPTETLRPAKPYAGLRMLTGLLGGFLAGVPFIALNSWYATTMGKPSLDPFRTVATLVQGPGALPGTSVVAGMAIHSALSAVLGIIFAGLLIRMNRSGLLLAGGLVFGGVVYVVDFQILARFVHQFHAFRMTNQPLELAVHLVFGAVLAMVVAVSNIGTRRRATRRTVE
jgi:hypothetical protein